MQKAWHLSRMPHARLLMLSGRESPSHPPTHRPPAPSNRCTPAPSAPLPAPPGGTQGLSLGDLFSVHGRGLKAVLHELEVPVRAVVIPMQDAKVAGWLHEAVMRHLAPIMPDAGMWVQNHGLYHSTVFHASTHTVGAGGERVVGCCWAGARGT